MKTAWFVSLTLTFCLALSASAARKFDFFVQPNFSTGFGNSEYVLDEDGYVAQGVLGHVKSELTFPIDATYSGITFGLRSNAGSTFDWSVLATYTVGVRDPRSKMFDGDWMNWPGQIDSMIGSTYSDVRQSARLWSIEARAAVAQDKVSSFGFAGGFQFQKIQQDLINLDGKLMDVTSLVVYDVSMRGPVGYYEITWKTPYGGFYLEVRPRPRWSFDVMAAFAPSWASDKDLHLLRHRESTADGNGGGFLARARSEVVLGKSPAKFRPTIALAADYYSLSATAPQNLYWYGRDGTTPGGTTISDVPHHLVSRELLLSLRLGVRF